MAKTLAAPIPTPQIQPGADGKFTCPECGAIYDARAGLGVHRRAAHNVSGTSTGSLHWALEKLERDKQKASGDLDSLPDSPVAKVRKSTKKSLTTMQVVTPIIAEAPSPKLVKRKLNNGQDHHPTPEEETIIAYAVGKLEQQAHQLAFENGLPAKQFARWVAQYFQLSTSR